MRKFRFKRFIDLYLSIVALIVLSPLFLVIWFIIRKEMGSPAFFKQMRPGIGGKPFVLYKFRTMKDAYDAKGTILPDSKRLTRFGKFIRSTSLDELPEFWNVIKGDMSIVGPRPLLMEYIDYYDEYQLRRHDVLPGITGWAQVNGRNAISWNEKFQFDLWYVGNYSILLDFKIIILTIRKVIKRDGISADDHATMPFFRG